MRKYEALFILNVATEDGVKDAIDKVTTRLQALGCNILGLQKMDRHNFARVADRRYTAGYYVNFVLEAEPEVADRIKTHFALDEVVFRVMVTRIPQTKSGQQKDRESWQALIR